MEKNLNALLKEQSDIQDSISNVKAAVEQEAAEFYNDYLEGDFAKFPDGTGATMAIAYKESIHLTAEINAEVNAFGYSIFFESVSTGAQYTIYQLNSDRASTEPTEKLGEGLFKSIFGKGSDSPTGSFDLKDLLSSLEGMFGGEFTTPDKTPDRKEDNPFAKSETSEKEINPFELLFGKLDKSVENLENLADATACCGSGECDSDEDSDEIVGYGNPKDFSEEGQMAFQSVKTLLDADRFIMSSVFNDEIEFDFENAVVCISDRSGRIPPVDAHISILVSRLSKPTDEYVVYLYDGTHSVPSNALELKKESIVTPTGDMIQNINREMLRDYLEVSKQHMPDGDINYKEQALCLDDDFNKAKELLGEDLFNALLESI